MVTSTISTTITNQVTPGFGSYAADITITNTGEVTSGTATSAIYVKAGVNLANIVNFGTILGGASAAVEFKTNATLTNYGNITGQDNGIDITRGVIDNLGTIFGENIGVLLGGGRLINSGVIDGSRSIVLDGSAYAKNTGQIGGGSVLFNDSILNNAGGTISGDVDDSGSFINAGLVASGEVEVKYGALTNIGNIYGLFPVGVNNGIATNLGTIGGRYIGVGVGTLGTLVNWGLINATVADGLEFLSGSSVENFGIIQGITAGIYAPFGTVSATNSGVIEGTTYAVLANDLLNLTVDSGAQFIGKVDDISGNGTISLEAVSAGSLDMGDSFIGFSAIEFGSFSSWALAGSLPNLANGQTITGFGPGDKISLEGFQATTSSVDNGVGISLSGVSGNASLDILNSLTGVLIIEGSGDTTSISDQTKTYNRRLLAGTQEFVLTGGSVVNTLIKAGAVESVANGGLTHNTTIDGGLLEISGGATGKIRFKNDGSLVVEGTIMPIATITGFAPGDSIELTALPAGITATATVEKAGFVKITAGKTTFKLKIAGAEVGSTAFHVTNSILTISPPPEMMFVHPKTIDLATWLPAIPFEPAHSVIINAEDFATAATLKLVAGPHPEFMAAPHRDVQIAVTFQSG